MKLPSVYIFAFQEPGNEAKQNVTSDRDGYLPCSGALVDEIESELASALVQTLVSSGLISNREERSVHSSIMDI